jgi:hypothetical protein
MSVLRQLQQEWNALVPAGQARGLPIREVSLYPQGLHERITHRRARLEWLRAQLGTVANVDQFSFGVELEFTFPVGNGHTREALAAAVRQLGIGCNVEVYNHSVRAAWKIVTDATCGYEMVSPVLRGQAGLNEVTKVCDAMVAYGCKVNKSCGLHVHVGVRGQQVEFFKNLIRLYASAEGAIDSFLAPSRRGAASVWCQPVCVGAGFETATTVDEVALTTSQTPGEMNVRNHTRYRKVNLQPYWSHGTVEFRQHQGTVEAAKVTNWVRLVLRMAETATAGAKTAATVDELMTVVGATDSERTYFTSRATYFARNTAARRAA